MPAFAHLPTATGHARTSPKFRIVAETEDYLVVEKPPFLLIHPSKPDGTPTLWAALREVLAFELVNGGQVSIVNRLDRETSGLVLIAKKRESARRFGLAMERRLVEKEYLAIVESWPDLGNDDRGRAARPAGRARPFGHLAETNDSRRRRAGRDRIAGRRAVR